MINASTTSLHAAAARQRYGRSSAFKIIAFAAGDDPRLFPFKTRGLIWRPTSKQV
jgi:hypothetical protein